MLVNSQNTTQSKDGLRNKEIVESETKYQCILQLTPKIQHKAKTPFLEIKKAVKVEGNMNACWLTPETLHKAKADLEIQKLVKLKEDISAAKQVKSKVQHKADGFVNEIGECKRKYKGVLVNAPKCSRKQSW